MWGAPEEPPDDTEVAAPLESMEEPPSGIKDTCEDNRSQLEIFKDIMLKNKKDLKKKEKELQEYASKLSQIKSRSKRSRLSKDSGASSAETTPKSRGDSSLPGVDEDTVDDISQAKTPKAKSSLLQRKLAENRKIFERRSKEMTENKRAVEEKVEAIRQQMDQTDLTMVESRDPLSVTPVRPVLITPQIVSPTDLQIGPFQDKDNKIAELSNRILELEATVIDLQDNLREKDSVIDSKTRAVTLMSADLSKKGKSTLDTLEDTKDEMRAMQENFVLIESSLRDKNENLLQQLQEQNERVTDLEATINRYEEEMEEKRLSETATATLSRTTMDTLADTKDEMRSMQENFVLIETSLREKNDHLLKQLQERDTKLAEAVEKIYKFEAGAGVLPAPEIPDLRYKIDKLERSNLALQDEKYELQKSIADLQSKIVARESSNGNGLIVEKDNRIAELENLIEELKNSNQLLEEESKAELQKQVDELATKNDDLRSKIDDLERLNNDLETEKNELREKIPAQSAASEEDAIVNNLKKELDDSNKSMIKLKAQHKSKLRNLQRQLENFKMVSDANAELVKLGNQVAVLEEEKGNLQLSLVDFDELKATTGDWQDRIADLENRVSNQANDIQAHVEAIAILENQKLDLMQDLHTAKQEISSLEAENAESENLRVTAEMKIVDMEEQIESWHKQRDENATSEILMKEASEDWIERIENLTRENSELVQRIAKLEEKSSSEAGSTESFETIHEDRNDLLKKLEALSTRNVELEEKLSRMEEANGANVDSTEFFETINDTERSELVKKIDALSRENNDLVTRLNKFEEKGSSDTGSTESFEKIPEHVEGSSRIEALVRENSELVIQLTKLEEKMDNLAARQTHEINASSSSVEIGENDERLNNLIRENSDLVIELTKLQEKLSRVSEDKNNVEKLVEDAKLPEPSDDDTRSRMDSLTAENHDLIIKLVKLEEKNAELRENLAKINEAESSRRTNEERESSASTVTVLSLENEIADCRKLISEQTELVEEMKTKLADKEAELAMRMKQIGEYEAAGNSSDDLQRRLTESLEVIEEWKYKCENIERKMGILETGKIAIEDGLKILEDENRKLIKEREEKDLATSALRQELDEAITTFANRLDEEREIAVKQEDEINSLRELLRVKDRELHEKYHLLQNEMINIDSLQEELNERRAQLESKDHTIFALNEEIQSLRAETIVCKEQDSACQAEIVVLREQLSTKAAKEARNEEIVEEINKTLNKQLRENESLRKMLENSSAEIEHSAALLISKDNEVAALREEKSLLEDKIRDSTIARDEAESELHSLQNRLDDSAKYADDLRAELDDAYRMTELLKAKHSEDLEMQNRRLEDLVEALDARTSECEILQIELTNKTKLVEELEAKRSELELCRTQLMEKEILVGRNVTEKVKVDLELRVNELEEKLLESEASTQSQLQKRKVLAANLKKKSLQYEELEAKMTVLEARIAELEPKAAELEAKAIELEPKAAEFEARAREFEAKAAVLETKVTELEATIAELEPKAADFESKAIELGAKVTELEATIAELEPRAATFEARATELGFKATEFEAEAKELRIKVAQLETRATDSERRVFELEHEASSYEAKAFQLEAKATELEVKASEYESRATEFQAKASYFEAKVQELEPKITKFEVEAAELEAKTAELEEKWISEKSEKEASNLKIQENERTIQEKSELIIQLEDRLEIVQSEASLSLNRVETLSAELVSATERIAALMSQVTELVEETEKLRSNIDAKSSELHDERTAKDNLMQEYETKLQSKSDEETRNQQVLDEAKEKARELGVRMQVMESEYVEQLNTIQTLKTENGMLVSKQAQINERLENAEKEASERKILLDQMQRETGICDRNEATSEDERPTNDEKQSCDHCDQRQTVVQALEAKLQERDAEIENLDNELANSIGNFVHMRESLRVSDLMNQSTSRSRSHEDARETSELVAQYNVLTARNAELGEKLNSKIRENDELRERIESLEALNAALRERTGAATDALMQSDESPMTNIDVSDDQLRGSLRDRDNELRIARSELETIKQANEESAGGMRSKMEELQSHNVELTRTFDELTRSRNEAETMIVSLREDAARYERKIIQLQTEVDKYKEESQRRVEGDPNNGEPRAASSFSTEGQDDGPKLFDAAKLFGPSVIPDSNAQKELAELRNAVAKKDLDNIGLSQEIKGLDEKIFSMESHIREMKIRSAQELQISRDNCQRLETEVANCQELLVERNRRIESLNAELNNVGPQILGQLGHEDNDGRAEGMIEGLRIEKDECVNKLRDRESTIERLSAEKLELSGRLESSEANNVEWIKSMELVSSILTDIFDDFTDHQNESLSYLNLHLPAMHSRLMEMKNYLDFTRNERKELVALLENYKQRIDKMEEEFKSSNDPSRIQELEDRADKILRERDAKQLQVNDLTRSLEEMQESIEKASSNEEIRLRNLQASLDRALSDNDRLKVQLDGFSRESETPVIAHTEERAQSEEFEIAEIREPRQAKPSVDNEAPVGHETGWDDEPKFDDEMWNPEDAEFAEGQSYPSGDTLLPNLERRLNARIDELQDTIRDLRIENDKLSNEIQSSQTRSGKLVKKLKEFKIQNESLQRQLKMQKATVDFCDLDTAIEEELKSQIAQLEKALNEAKEETRKISLERDNLTKRIDVLSSANERLVEMKERQDMEVEVLQIRTKELANKLESMERQCREARPSEEAGEENRSSRTPSLHEKQEVKEPESLQLESVAKNMECLCSEYKAEIDELRDEIEALAAENEQLQKLLEEQRATRLSTESKLNEQLAESARAIDVLSGRNTEIQKEVDDARKNYESLMERYERATIDSQQDIAAAKQNHDILKIEIAENTKDFEDQMSRMRDEMDSATTEITNLREKLQSSLDENKQLIERTKSLEETTARLDSLGESMTELTELLNARVQEVAELKQEAQRLRAEKNEALDTVVDLAQNEARELAAKNVESQRYIVDCESRLEKQGIEMLDLRDKLSNYDLEVSTCRTNVEHMLKEIERLNNCLIESRSHRESLQSELAGKEQELFRDEDEVRKYMLEVERLNEMVGHLEKSSADTLAEANRRIREIEERETSLKRTISELTTRESEAVGQLYREISEKDNQVANLQETVLNLEEKINQVTASYTREKIREPKEITLADDTTSVTTANYEIRQLQMIVDELRRELSEKNEEIENYKYQLSESTYPSIIQALQDQVNKLYEEKLLIEQSLNAALQDLSEERELKERLAENSRYQSRRLKSIRADETDETGREFGDYYEISKTSGPEDEVRALRMTIDEGEARFRDLQERYQNVEIEINELRLHLATKEEEIAMLQQRFDATRQEIELLRTALKPDLPSRRESGDFGADDGSTTSEAQRQSSNELDLALYMLHQRDVRCDELTHELMQLLEERDTLQLRLSNAIRVNEELRRSLPIEAQTSDAHREPGDEEPIVEQPSPSRAVGPVEIAKEAMDTPNEEKIVLAQKLSQLHNTGHGRDVRLMDDRELRHNQQMSLLAHRDVLSTLPPEAAARLVNANYTLSRDVQSQSSILMNWLWGKSTPKVVHM